MWLPRLSDHRQGLSVHVMHSSCDTATCLPSRSASLSSGWAWPAPETSREPTWSSTTSSLRVNFESLQQHKQTNKHGQPHANGPDRQSVVADIEPRAASRQRPLDEARLEMINSLSQSRGARRPSPSQPPPPLGAPSVVGAKPTGHTNATRLNSSELAGQTKWFELIEFVSRLLDFAACCRCCRCCCFLSTGEGRPKRKKGALCTCQPPRRP